MKLKLMVLTGFLLTLVSLSAERNPVTRQEQLPKDILEPWMTEHWSHYSGIYEALEVEGNASGRIVLTAFAGVKEVKLVSACMIVVSDLFAEPFYKIYGSIEADEESGKLKAYSIENWKMIRYTDPITKEPVFGISIDGRIYVDRSKTKMAEQAGADQQPTKSADKPPVKDKPSPPTSKDRPR